MVSVERNGVHRRCIDDAGQREQPWTKGVHESRGLRRLSVNFMIQTDPRRIDGSRVDR
jgi:hypothetical protein